VASCFTPRALKIVPSAVLKTSLQQCCSGPELFCVYAVLKGIENAKARKTKGDELETQVRGPHDLGSTHGGL